jgi:nitrate/nitrite transporter NarK
LDAPQCAEFEGVDGREEIAGFYDSETDQGRTWFAKPNEIARSHGTREDDFDAVSEKLTASSNVLVLLSVMYFITYVDRVNISTAAPAIKGEFGLSNTELGLIFSAFAYPYALFQVFGGWLGDK